MAKLVDRRDSRVDKLSGGMRRRLLIARALDPPSPARAARRAHGRPRPAGAPGALGADRRAPRRGHDDPDVDPLHRGGAAPRGHRDDHVPRQRRRRRPASELVLEHAGHEVLEVYGPPKRLAEVETEAGAAGLRTRRTGTSVSILGSTAQRLRDRRRAPAGEPRGRLRPADRRGDRMSVDAAAAGSACTASSAPRSRASSCARS